MLSYTKVTAPIDGRTGLRLIDEGNLVQAGDTAKAMSVLGWTPKVPARAGLARTIEWYRPLSRAELGG